MFQSHFESIENALSSLRVRLLDHPLYEKMVDIPSLHRFMQDHVFAVWDFMSMLKALQQELTCTSVPWIPSKNSLGCRLVNEIVLGEESDENGETGFASHFELYLHAMRAAGATEGPILRFVAALSKGETVRSSLSFAEVPPHVAQFVEHTFQVIETHDLPALASAFTFGREDLLPEVFEQIVNKLNQDSGGKLEPFIYYLNRHIELDGDHHGPMAMRLMESLCENDEAKWKSAQEAAEKALEVRLVLWDGILKSLE